MRFHFRMEVWCDAVRDCFDSLGWLPEDASNISVRDVRWSNDRSRLSDQLACVEQVMPRAHFAREEFGKKFPGDIMDREHGRNMCRKRGDIQVRKKDHFDRLVDKLIKRRFFEQKKFEVQKFVRDWNMHVFYE